MGGTIAAVTAVRRYRDLAGVKPSAVLPARLELDVADGLGAQVAQLARLSLGDGDAVASVPVAGGTVELLASPDFDVADVGRRIEGERDRLRGEIERLEKKLGNARFVERAPADVVEGERGKAGRVHGGARTALRTS